MGRRLHLGLRPLDGKRAAQLVLNPLRSEAEAFRALVWVVVVVASIVVVVLVVRALA